MNVKDQTENVSLHKQFTVSKKRQIENHTHQKYVTTNISKCDIKISMKISLQFDNTISFDWIYKN